MSVKVKICGIRTIEAALVAVDAGAHFLGFNFVPTSKRFIDPISAKKIIDQIKGKIEVVGVFQDAQIAYVNELAQEIGLDFVQLHGSEDPDYISYIKVPVIKAISIGDDFPRVAVKFFLLDRINRGEGEMLDLQKASQISKQFPIFFAGGLNSENVAQVISTVNPFAVDVAGGVETDGVQDLEKIKLFIKNVSGVLI